MTSIRDVACIPQVEPKQGTAAVTALARMLDMCNKMGADMGPAPKLLGQRSTLAAYSVSNTHEFVVGQTTPAQLRSSRSVCVLCICVAV